MVALALVAGALVAAAYVGGCGGDSTTSAAGNGGSGEGAGTGTHTTTSSTSGHPTSSTGSPTTSTTTTAGGAGPTGSGGAGGAGVGGSGGTPPLYDCADATGTVPTLTLTDLGNTFGQALLVKVAPGDPDSLYVVDRTGNVWIYRNGAMLPTPFLTVQTQEDGEEGLLGLTFHPDYVNNGRLFVHYSKQGNGDNIVQEFARSADPDVATAGPIALEHTTAETNHNGGSVEFGPDGFLYISMGDGGNQGDPECDAQLHTGGEASMEPEDLLGKITRLDVDQPIGPTGYPAAAGNPMGLKAYHIGFRNPFRMSFDLCTGDLFIGDVGQNTYEEVDQIAQSEGPVNCGWPYREGTHAFATPNTCPPQPTPLKEPILDYQHQSGRNAVIGGFMYRSTAIPSLRGAYFYGDNGSGEIWYVQGASLMTTTPLSPGGGVLGGFGQDGRGNVYVASLDGHLYRIDPQ
jgi:glucose/arabinose dehydrogenase